MEEAPPEIIEAEEEEEVEFSVTSVYNMMILRIMHYLSRLTVGQ